MQLQRSVSTLALLAISASLACSKNAADTATPTSPAPVADVATEPTASAEEPAADAWTVALTGDHRSADNKARDQYRHPRQTLEFFGVTPSSTVVELAPGGGWYTEVLAPLLRDEGKLIVTSKDPAGPESYYGTRQAKAWQDKVADASGVFGKVETVVVPLDLSLDAEGKVEKITHKPFELGAEGSVDVVVSFRSSHGWYRRDALELVFGAAFRVLKPGGTFGLVQHRAAEGADAAATVKSGYLPEATIVAAAKSAGFELGESSDINANPKDTRDYEKGVWTLPPGLAEGDKDKDKYLAIGESDRMTLKFVKPAK